MTPKIKKIIEDEAKSYEINFFFKREPPIAIHSIGSAFEIGAALGFRLGVEEAAKVAESQIGYSTHDLEDRHYCGGTAQLIANEIRALLEESRSSSDDREGI